MLAQFTLALLIFISCWGLSMGILILVAKTVNPFLNRLLGLTIVIMAWRPGAQRAHNEAAMLPFADDPEVAQRVERDTGRSIRGCACPGTCDGHCEHLGRREF